MASTKYLSIVFTGEDKSATKTFKQVDDAADNTGSKLAQLGSKISPAVAAASAAVVAGVGFAMKSAFDAATESAQISRETERVIQTTGAAAWTSAGQVGDLAQKVSNLTGKDDELIQSSANLLLTFSNVKNQLGEGNDVFDQAVGLALDMSTALGTDASSASIQLGKALNDPVKGITALSRAGVSFTAEQKDQIKTLVATGDTLGAQKIILQELGKEFGGAAEAAKTPIETLKTKLENLAEDVGTVIMPVIGTITDVVGGVVDSFMALPEPVKNAVLIVGGVGLAALGAIPLVAKIADTFSDIVGPAMKIFRGVVDNVALGLGTMAEKLTGNADLGQKLASGLSSSVAPALMAVTAAAVIGFGIWTMYQNAQKENKQRAEDFTTALTSETSAINDNVAAVITKQLADSGAGASMAKAGANVALFTNAITSNGTELEKIAGWADDAKHSIGGPNRFIDNINAASASGSELAQELIRVWNSGQLTSDQFYNMIGSLDKTSDAYDTGKKEAEVYKTVQDGVALSTGNATNATLGQIQSLKDLADELRAQTDPWFAAYKAQQSVTEAQTKLNEATAKYGPNSKEAKDAALANAEAAIGLKGDLLKLKEANLDGAGAPELAAQWADLKRFGFDPAAQAAKNVGVDILAMGTAADTVDGKTATVTLNANDEDARAKIGKAARAVANLHKQGGFFGNVLFPMYDSIARSMGYARGGMVQDGPFIVGEQGPELGYKMGSSVRIFSNPESKQMVSGGSMSGGPVNVYVNNSGASPYEIGREVLWATKVAG